MFKLLVGASAIISTGILVKRTLADTASKIWERISFSIPPSSFKVQIGLAKLLVTSNLQIDNQNNMAVQVAGLSAILKYKNNIGELVEVGRTAPNNKSWTIGARQTTIIDNIQISVGALAAFKAAKNAMNKPEGQRLLVQFSGTINSLPLSYDYWY